MQHQVGAAIFIKESWVLVALRQLRWCIENEIENFEDYAIRYENAEDFDIVDKERSVISRHQVKAYINGNEREDYSDLFNIQKRKFEDEKKNRHKGISDS